jgi:putative nucleotidyltransferase with HDIG domain
VYSIRVISLTLVSVTSAVLALAVYTRDRRNPANRSFAATAIMSMVWLWFALLSDLPQLQAYSLLFNRLTLAAAALWALLAVNFGLVFPHRRDRVSPWARVFLVAGFAMAMLAAATPLVVAGVVFRAGGTDVISGPAFVVYGTWMLSAAVVFFFALRRKYRMGAGRERAQIKYLLVGTLLFAVPSAIFGMIIPAITHSYAISVLNTFTPLVLFGFVSYAMVRHRLMDMRFVVLRGMVYTVLVGVLSVFYLLLAQAVRAGFADVLGVNSEVAFVLAGLAAVFLFQPLRAALESYTDHIFYRRRYDQQALLQRLAAQLVGVVDISEIASAASRVLAEQIKASRIALVHEESGALAVYGEAITSDDSALPEIMAVANDGRLVLDDELREDSRAAALLRERGIQVVAPLLVADTTTAVLLLGEKMSGEVYTEQDLHFLQALSTELAIALKTCELFEQREQRVRELTALNRLASVLGQDIQLDSLLGRALRQVVSVAGADGGSIMLLDSSTRELVIRAAFGLSFQVVRDTHIVLGEGIAGWVAQHCKPLLLIDGDAEQFSGELERQGVKSAISVPLVSKEQVIGVLNLSRSSSASNFTQQNMSVVTSFGAQLAVAIENAQLYSDLKGYFIGTITALAAAVDAKDPYTFGHSSEVTDAALAIAAEMGLSAEETENLRKAAILHDIGKIGVDGAILNKPGPLDPEERAVIMRHPSIGANILGSLEFLDEVVPIVLHHHERFDGKGYPDGIAGEQIPLGARIITVADSYNAMTSDRTYRRALSREEALSELERNAGTQFDPSVVKAFMRTPISEGQTPERAMVSVGAPDAFATGEAVVRPAFRRRVSS